MINIITGSVNSGKSTKLVDIYKNLGKGDGFFNRKIYSGNLYVGQEIVRMSNGESMIWSLREEVLDYWEEQYCYADFSFSKDALKFAEEIVNSSIKSNDIIFVDEIGPLELQNKGFHNLFKCCLNSNKELYVVVREGCLEAVLRKYKIEDYEIVANDA